MIKKLILLLIMLSTFTSESYASFPIIADTLETTIDTLQTEEIKQYHSSLIKMGIDLNACRCESCRNGIAPLTNNVETNSTLKKNKKNIWIRILIIMTILSIVLVILLFRWAENFNKSGGIGG